MRDIKTKERDRKPKVMEKASRMPKELARKAALETKEKSLQGSRVPEGQGTADSPSGYAADRTEAALKRGAEDGGRAAVKTSYAAGKEAARKTYRKLQERSASEKRERNRNAGACPEEASEAPEAPKPSEPKKAPGVSGDPDQRGQAAAKKDAGKEAAQKKARVGQPEGQAGKAAPRAEKSAGKRTIRTREAASRTIREPVTRQVPKGKAGERTAVKRAPRILKSPAFPETKVGRTAAASGRARAEKMAKQAAVRNLRQGARRMERAALAVVRFKRAVEEAAKAIRNGAIALAAGAGSMFLVLVTNSPNAIQDPEYVPHVLRYYSGGNPFGALFGNEQIVSVALSQLGNAGGQKFWSWYGFDSHVSWCACFASWCGDQCGLIESGQIPKFSLCDDGIAWFKGKGKWQERGYSPSPGTLIFFDWPDHNGNRDGSSDHVGIVEKCEGGIVYTVEGNSSNAVNQRSYDMNNASIMGYGVVTY